LTPSPGVCLRYGVKGLCQPSFLFGASPLGSLSPRLPRYWFMSRIPPPVSKSWEWFGEVVGVVGVGLHEHLFPSLISSFLSRYSLMVSLAAFLSPPGDPGKELNLCRPSFGFLPHRSFFFSCVPPFPRTVFCRLWTPPDRESFLFPHVFLDDFSRDKVFFFSPLFLFHPVAWMCSAESTYRCGKLFS